MDKKNQLLITKSWDAFSDLEGTQTLDLQNRNLTFYSTELRGLSCAKI